MKREVLPDKCANSQCSNQPGQGRFEIVEVNTLKLFLCTPCSNALYDAIQSKEGEKG